ncbi:MAG: galactitol-1-phosphate 5-dehydrogenase [Verrucomicrobiae bacterium]|nr:galactitol-1-phosphate 5-dehydrogenase [Verrucomicrobiae bacterium]
MKALLLTDYKKLELVGMPEPAVGPEDLLVRVHACGICGSDVHGYDGRTGRRIPPIVMGHEAAGVVAKVGSNVRQFRVGDRVTFDSTIYCGQCFFCRRGQVNLCDHRRVLGVSCGDYRQHGAFAEFVAVPERIAHRLPDGLSFDHAAMIEAVSIALHATNRTPVRPGDNAVVVGAGMIGLLVIQTLRRAGCGRVIAVDVDEKRHELARPLGAGDALDAKADVPAEVIRLTDGRGADIAVEAVGAAGPIHTAIASLRKGGALTLVGNLAPKVEMPLQAIVTRELSLNGTCASCGEYPACIELLAGGHIQVAPLISACAPLADGPAWFDRLYRQEPGLMKVILKP